MNELVAVDLDGTLLRGQSQKLLLFFLFRRRVIGLGRFLSILYWFIAYRFGIASHPGVVMETAFSFLRGSGSEEAEPLWDEFFESCLRPRFYEEGLSLIAAHKAAGRRVILVSNAVDPIVVRAARHIGADDHLSTRLEVVGERYTGKVGGAVMYAEEKTHRVTAYVEKLGLRMSDVWSYGDHESDAHLLRATGRPHATNASAALKRIASAHRWPLVELSR